MIGIVVVSHSHRLAQAAVALAREMVDPADAPPVEVAAGLDEDTLGTDAVAVAEAIGRADTGDGVLVLLDLGSAVMSAEMALELLAPDVAARVRLSSAPMVEGLVSAVVTASTGAALGAVAGEAARGLVAKAEHLGQRHAAQVPATSGSPVASRQRQADRWLTREVLLTGVHGLHARPAARLVQCANAFPGARVQVRTMDGGRAPVDGRSVSALATLGAQQGQRLELRACGAQAKEVLQALEDLAGTAFGDDDGAESERPASPDAAPGPCTAVGGSGLEAAIGPVVRLDRPLDLTAYAAGDPAQERARLRQAVASARADLLDLRERTMAQLGPDEAAVFQAHLALLEDPALRDPVLAAVAAGSGAPQAWQACIQELTQRFEELSEEYQRERAQDVINVGERVLRLLTGEDLEHQQEGPVPGVLVTRELDPVTAATLDLARISGVVTLRGGATGHGVLIARARGLPVLTGAGPRADVGPGTVLAFDARTARLVVDPDPATRAELEALLARREEQRTQALATALAPARTSDGHAVRVGANLSAVTDADQALAAGADGAGLVRTEVLFAGRRQAPSVAEQVAAFTSVAESLPGRPVTIRTWDLGGDKPLAFHPLPREANPFLGVRGLRAFRADPRLLVDQLEAVCRVAERHQIRVLFPMVSTVEEVDWALARLDEAAGRLSGGRPDTLQVGIMVEVPAAALRIESLSTLLDFVSIGSNDLAQYTLAAERGNPGVSGLADQADPAVLRLVRIVCDDVAEGVDVCVCGEAASDPELAALLVGLGVHDLSATVAMVPMVKARLRRHSLADLRDLAERALRCDSAAEVRALVARSLEGADGVS